MNNKLRHAVTGAFGYSGRYLCERLLDAGDEVITLTNSLHRAHPFGGRVRAFPLSFDEPDKLAAALTGVGYAMSWMIGWFVRDNFLTRQEIKGLMDGLLCVDASPVGRTRLTDWMRANSATLGWNYASEMARRRDRISAYLSKTLADAGQLPVTDSAPQQ